MFASVPLTDAARDKLQPAIERSNVTWPVVERWLDDGHALLWQIEGGRAYVLAVSSEHEIEGVLAGGEGALEWVRPFERFMRDHPLHAGKQLVINGRKGWRRLLKGWREVNGELRLD